VSVFELNVPPRFRLYFFDEQRSSHEAHGGEERLPLENGS
jgi:hypothetical protein